MQKHIRNIAIVAHVDHGKTTLVDALLKQTQTFADHQSEMQQELLMDSGDQEKERGITITAKITAIEYQGVQINIIDTPGHADFGGEVERTLHMADGCLLIVDAQEGPMPQTRFVLQKAFQAGLQPMVVINKIDKPAANISACEDKIADLFLELADNESQLHYPTYYAIGREGKAWAEVPTTFADSASIQPILEAIVQFVPPPKMQEGGFQLLATSLEWDPYKGKMVIGKVVRGTATKNDPVVVVDSEKGVVERATIDDLYVYKGLGKVSTLSVSSGEIVALSGINDAQIGQTVAVPDIPEALPSIALEAPTLSIHLNPNTSPFKGRDGEFTTSRQIGQRLEKELQTNVGLIIEPEGIGYIIRGRGELHLSVLLETMRREGYEFEVGQPQVVLKEEGGEILEPYELITVITPAEHVGTLQREFGKRRAELIDQHALSDGSTVLLYSIATRALLGLRSMLMTATKGTLQMSSQSDGYKPKGPALSRQRNGALIAWDTAITTPYALQNAEARGSLFVGPGAEVYTGQIIGISNQKDDLDINITKEKHLTNMRSKTSDGTVQLTPPIEMNLEQCIDFLEADELLEITPKNLRLRKRALDRNMRKKKHVQKLMT